MNGRGGKYPVPPLPARLALVPEHHGLQPVAGGWWPRSRDLHRELLPLLRELEPRWGDITRVTVQAEMWRPGHASVPFADRMIHLVFSDRTASRHTVCLLSRWAGPCDLLVVPPQTAPDQAELLLTAAGRGPASSQPVGNGTSGEQRFHPGAPD